LIIIEKLAYSLHLGSDRNKRNSARNTAKTNKSGSTSLSNNAIQNARGLSRVDKHNYRKYDNDQDNIEIIRGTSSLYDDVKKLYIDEFEVSRIEYNKNQTRENRKINDYFTHVSNNSKNDLACEIIIELGDKKYWDTKDMEFKKRMTSVYEEQVNDLESLIPNFKVASAIIHYDETSPHLHIVGVPIKYKNKNGMEKQVGKSDVFTKESLRKLQDKMRILCIESFNKEYKLNHTLKQKMKGRGIDYHVSEMDNYQEMQKELEKNQEKLTLANEKALELDNISKDTKEIVNNLKTTITSKDKYVLNASDKDKIINYIEKVDKTNKEYKSIQTLSVTLNNVDEELKDNKEKIKTLTENNEALNLRIETLNKNIIKKNNEIKELKEENNKLKQMVIKWKQKFFDIINFIGNKIFNKHDREKYMDVATDLFENDLIEYKTYDSIREDYEYSVKKDKNKDDFEIGM